MSGRSRTGGLRAWTRAEDGALSLSTAIVVPGIILLLGVAIMAGRMATARGTVESAAWEAARAASISRTHATAQEAAQGGATAILSSADLDCTSLEVLTDLAALDLPVGQTGEVSVTVSCTVHLADLSVLGQADHTITHTATEPFPLP